MYPDVDDPRFGSRIAQKKEFREAVKHLVPREGKGEADGAASQLGFQPTSAQRLIRRFMSPATPYHAVLLFHMVGTGKTCTAIQVASQFMDRGKRALVLAPRQLLSNFSKEVYNIDKDSQDQCVAPVGAAAARFAASSTKRRNLRLYEAQRYVAADYELQSFPEFTNRMRGLKADLSEGAPGNEEVYRERVRRLYSGRVVVVDEVHHMRENEHVGKLLPPLLRDLVSMADDVRLVLMSATPMFNRAEEIVDVLNLMRLADRRPAVSEADIFDARTGQLNGSRGRDALRAAAAGYVSYADGGKAGAGQFPARLWAKPQGIPPKVDFLTRQRLPNAAQQAAALVCSTMRAGGEQEGWLREHASVSSPMDVSATLQRCNIMYPGMGSMSSVLRRVNQGQYAYLDRSDQFLAMPRLGQVAPKMAAIIQSLQQQQAHNHSEGGIVFVYSFFLEHGLVPLAIALEHAGLVRVDGQPLATGLSSSSGGSGAAPPLSGGYVILAPEVCRNIAETIAMINSPDNARGQRIRVVLGSSSVSEGVDLKCVRHVHVLEPWYNMNRIEQVIGRAVRRGSHATLPPKDRNVTVWLHATAFSQKKGGGGNAGDGGLLLESPDQHLYRVALGKQRVIQDVETVLKEAAFDRMLREDARKDRDAAAVNASTFSATHVAEVMPVYRHLIARAMSGLLHGATLEDLKVRLVDTQGGVSDPVDDDTFYQVLSAMVADRTPVGPAGECISYNPRTKRYGLASPSSEAEQPGIASAAAWHVLPLQPGQKGGSRGPTGASRMAR